MKKWIITITLFLITIFFSGYILFCLKEERKLNIEINKMYQTIQNWEKLDLDKFNTLSERTVTKNKYQIIEKATKTYIKDNITILNNIVNLIDESNPSNIISISNYETDGPDFTQTLAQIENTKASLTSEVENYYNFFTEEKIMSYLPNGSYSSKYTHLYQDKIIANYISKYKNEEVRTSVNTYLETLEEEKAIINFLIVNKSFWKIENNNIVFETEELLNDYNNLLTHINY